MSDIRSFTARPLSKQQARKDLKDAFRVYLSSSSLAALRLQTESICTLRQADGPPQTAIAWYASENIQSTVMQISRTLQECYDIKIGEKVSITRAEGPLDNVDIVTLADCSDPEKIAKHGSISESDRSHWEWALDEKLLRCGSLTTGLTFDLELRGQPRSFRVVNIHSQNPHSSHTLFQFTEASKVSLGPVIERKEEKSSGIEVQSTGLGGLSRQIDDINESLSDFNIDPRKPAMPSFYENSRGILLYGPKGTGKTSLLEHIEKAGWKQTFKVGMSTLGRSTHEGEVKLRNIFQEAARSNPSVIIIDQLDFIAPKRTSIESHSLASVLCENLDAIRNTSILVVAATRHPNQVDDALRTPHRLGTEIEIQVPTAQDRAEILRAIRGPVSAGLTDELVDLLAEKTHGYVGADLFALLQLVCRKARQRQLVEQNSTAISASPTDPYSWHHGGFSEDEPAISLEIQETDILLSLQEIRPTAMREVFLETPKVRWSDIGGQHDIKKRLQQAVERPLKSVVNPEVDLDNLASLTEGYSGAEIVSICETAGDAALDEEEETQQEQDVQWKHFEYALGQVRRQITDTVIEEYERWREGQKTEHGLNLYIVRNPEVKARPEALPEVRHADDAIAIVQKPDHDPRLVVEPGLAVAVEVVAVTIAEAKAAHLLPILALQEVLRADFSSTQQIVVEKLTKNVTENHIREIFGGFGEIEYLDLPINEAFMTNRGTAYILYYDPADAEAAIAHMHEAQLDGAILNVSIVLPRRKFSRSPPPASIRGKGGRPRLHRDHDLQFVPDHTLLDLAHRHPAEVVLAQTRGIDDAGAQATAVMVTAAEVAVQTGTEATIDNERRGFSSPVSCCVLVQP
ncbi:hypothetical protein N7519_010776 [Penicillium mononematosum]|uniref:uncharacterized protein n=1 Tax=Penicillium mononematosum TaxID=268346 RepID=UPI002546B085|nr:uncharacterized protein N7519_010776 [Penicillium mononematosum]KAJ6180315.1 hypothetical protein N7519_010776 [Penicillium mononematosum]